VTLARRVETHVLVALRREGGYAFARL
jgi:hypothetical protein